MLIRTREALWTLVKSWDPDERVGFDIELNGQPAWHPQGRIVGASLAGREKGTGRITAGYIPLAHQKPGSNANLDVLDALIAYLATARVVVYWAVVEHQWVLAKWRLALNVGGDAYVAGRMLHHRERGLKDMVETVLGKSPLRAEDIVGTLKDDGSKTFDFSALDPDDSRVWTYSCEDAVNALELEAALRPRLAEAKQLAAYELEIAASLVMAEQQLAGYAVSLPAVEASAAKAKLELPAAEMRVRQYLGPKVNLAAAQSVTKAMQALGIQSPIKTDTGNDSWAVEALELSLDAHPVCGALLAYKKLVAEMKRPEQVERVVYQDGKIHPKWRAIQLSGSPAFTAESPILADWGPRTRTALVPPAGAYWLRLAYDALDLSLLSTLVDDDSLRTLVRAPDIRQELSARVGQPADQALGLFYHWVRGGATLTALERVLVDFDKATALHDRFANQFRPLANYIDGVRKRAVEERRIWSWGGRDRELSQKPGIDLGAVGCHAVLSQSVWVFLKYAVLVLDRAVKAGSVRASQYVPLEGGLAFCAPVGALAATMAAVEDEMRTFFSVFEGMPPLRPVWQSGPTWGELRPVQSAAIAEAAAGFGR